MHYIHLPSLPYRTNEIVREQFKYPCLCTHVAFSIALLQHPWGTTVQERHQQREKEPNEHALSSLMEPSISKRSTCTSATSSDSIWSSLGDHIGILLPFLDAWSSHEKSCCRVWHRYLISFAFNCDLLESYMPLQSYFLSDHDQDHVRFLFVCTNTYALHICPCHTPIIWQTVTSWSATAYFQKQRKVPSQMWGMLSSWFRRSENWKAALCSPHNDLAVHVRTGTCLFCRCLKLLIVRR